MRPRVSTWPGVLRLMVPLIIALMLQLVSVHFTATGALAQSRVSSSVIDGIADDRARTLLLATVRDADSTGVPLEPLYSKIREGVAKQSSPDRIAVAVQQLSARLSVARDALAQALASDEIAAGAGALQVGVPTSALRQLRREWPRRSLTVPLGVLTELVAYGVSETQATARVRVLMASGVTNAQLVELGTQVQTDIISGGTARTVFEQRAHQTMSVLATQRQSGRTTTATPPPIRP